MASLGLTLHVRTDFHALECLQGLDERLNEAMRETAYDGTDVIYQAAVANIPKRTGRTAGTIGEVVVPKGNGGTGYVGSSDMIAKFLEFGTRPHVIEGHPTLFFEGTFARRVNHPGTQAYNWLLNAGEGSVGAVIGIAEGHVEAALAC